jgi:hypothetical protein
MSCALTYPAKQGMITYTFGGPPTLQEKPPMRLARVPDHDVLPTDFAATKARARDAWQAAKAAHAAPPLLLDRWWSDALLAVRDAPAHVQLVLLHRSEVLFRLLIDRTRWLDRA